MMLAFDKTHFIKSAETIAQCPPDIGKEIAVIGRSNSGKSSLINVLTQQKKLARVSKTPGRTQLINFFGIDDMQRLVDLPGYGFAKIAQHQQRAWETMVQGYLEHRESLVGLILIMDIRHPLKESDCQMLAWAHESQLRTHIILNKSDKLNRHETRQAIQKVQNYCKAIEYFSVQAFSALKMDGVKELIHTICRIFSN